MSARVKLKITVSYEWKHSDKDNMQSTYKQNKPKLL